MYRLVHQRVQGVTRGNSFNVWGSRFQRMGESFFYASATDWKWVTSFFIIFDIQLQKYTKRTEDGDS